MAKSPMDWREARRLRALELHDEGWKQYEIADALGVTPGAVSQWLKAAREGGLEALRARKHPGPTARLSPGEQTQLVMLLMLGAEFHGFRGDLWTCPRVAVLIERVFAVRYHPAHVSRLLAALDWTPQQPTERASQRDEQAIERWRSETWPALKKGPASSAARSAS